MLDPKTKARIAQEAKSYAGTTLPNVPIGVPKTFVDEGKRKHYIAGAEAEADVRRVDISKIKEWDADNKKHLEDFLLGCDKSYEAWSKALHDAIKP